MDEEQRNFILAILLSSLVLGLSMYFRAPAVEEGESGGPVAEKNVTPESPAAPPMPEQAAEVESTPSVPKSSSEHASATPSDFVAPKAEERIRIQTPLYDVEFSTLGGGISHWWLNSYRDLDENPIELTTTDGADLPIALSTPLLGLGVGDFSKILFSFKRLNQYELLFTAEQDGVRVQKHYRFNPDSYLFDLKIEIENRSAEPRSSELGIRWPSEPRHDNDFAQQQLIAFQVDKLEKQRIGAVGKPGFFARFSGKTEEGHEKAFVGDIAWAGEQTRYFLAVILPEDSKDAMASFLRAENGSGAITEVARKPVVIEPGHSILSRYRVFVGPKEPERLKEIGVELSRTTDMGWSFIRPIVRGFRWGLLALNKVFHNFGISIIVITILMKIGTAPLTAKQMTSMKRMGELKPQLDALKEKHGDDRQAFGQAQMELYRKEGVNPMGGCLPMVVQFPVFIGLYYALQSTIELRHAHFIGWITDLSAPETLFSLPGLGFPVRLLPLIMGVSMVVQQRMTPSPSMDPAQARMMKTVMPLMMTVMFYQFPSGLVLYWLMSNVITIAHTAWLHRETPAAA